MEADIQSRKDYKHSNWMLHRNIFDNICKILKFDPEIDCFANRLNHQIPKYISYKPDPDEFLVDAFSVNWSLYKCYLFPPFSLVGRVLQKIKIDGALALIIAPSWTTQPWYTTLMSMALCKPILVSPGQNNLILPSDATQIHPLWKKLTLLACLVSG